MERDAKQYAEFITVTLLKWIPLLKEDGFKDIIVKPLSPDMANSWEHKRDAVYRDFLKFTSQRILFRFRREESPVLEKLLVNAKDRKYQVWKRNSLSISLWSDKALWQKLEYIHNNPVSAGICKCDIDYK